MAKIERMRRRFGFDYAEYVQPVNTGGGLALWWKERIELEILGKDKNHIHLQIAGTFERLCDFSLWPANRE